VVGIATAFQLVVNAPYLTANSTPAERPHLFSLNIVITLGATVLGEVVGGALPIWLRSTHWLMAPLAPWLEWALASQTGPRSYQLAMLLAGIIAIPSLIPYFFMSDDRPSHRVRQASTKQELPDGRSFQLPLIPTGSTALKQAAPVLEAVPASPVLVQRPSLRAQVPVILTSWREHLRPEALGEMVRSPIFMLVVVQSLIAAGAGLFIPYFNLFFVQHLGASSALFGLIDGGANGLNALLTLLAPLLAARTGKIVLITITRLASVPIMLTVGLSGMLPLAAAFYPLRQGLMDMSSSIFQVFSMEAVPQEHRGLANSSYQASYQVALALTTPLGGLIIAHAGYTPVFLIAAVFYLTSIAILWFRFGRHAAIRQ
jgi:MFS family permease